MTMGVMEGAAVFAALLVVLMLLPLFGLARFARLWMRLVGRLVSPKWVTLLLVVAFVLMAPGSALAVTATPTPTPAGTATPTFTPVPTSTPIATVAAEGGHAPNRVYTGQDGNFHANGASVVDSSNNPLVATNADLNALKGLSAATERAPVTVVAPLAAASPVAAAQAAWQNVTPGRVLIERVILDVTTACTTSSSTLNIGTTTASALTMSSNLLDTAACTSIATLDNISNGGTNGKAVQSLASGGWVTVAPNQGDTTALVGNLYIEYIPV